MVSSCGATTVTRAPARSSRSILRSATLPPPTTRQGMSRSLRKTGRASMNQSLLRGSRHCACRAGWGLYPDGNTSEFPISAGVCFNMVAPSSGVRFSPQAAVKIRFAVMGVQCSDWLRVRVRPLKRAYLAKLTAARIRPWHKAPGLAPDRVRSHDPAQASAPALPSPPRDLELPQPQTSVPPGHHLAQYSRHPYT